MNCSTCSSVQNPITRSTQRGATASIGEKPFQPAEGNFHVSAGIPLEFLLIDGVPRAQLCSRGGFIGSVIRLIVPPFPRGNRAPRTAGSCESGVIDPVLASH